MFPSPAAFTTMAPGNPWDEAYARLLHGAALSELPQLVPDEVQSCQEEFQRIWRGCCTTRGDEAGP